MPADNLRELYRLDAAGFAPPDIQSVVDRLAWGLLNESIDRLRYMAECGPTDAYLGEQFANAVVFVLRRRLEEVGASVDRLEATLGAG